MTSSELLRIGNKYTTAGVTSSAKQSKVKSSKSGVTSGVKQRKATNLQRFKSFFGITPHVCSIVWEQVKKEAPAESKPKHLLWCLNFLKQYTNEHTRKSLFKADEKTIRKWTWIYIELLSKLNVVCTIASISICPEISNVVYFLFR